MAQGRRRGFDIEYAKESLVDLMALAVRDRAIVRDQIEAQLRGEPLRETRNRKPTAPNSLGAWELRVQPYRVFYNVDEADRVVEVTAVLYKDRSRTFRRGEEVDTHE